MEFTDTHRLTDARVDTGGFGFPQHVPTSDASLLMKHPARHTGILSSKLLALLFRKASSAAALCEDVLQLNCRTGVNPHKPLHQPIADHCAVV